MDSLHLSRYRFLIYVHTNCRSKFITLAPTYPFPPGINKEIGEFDTKMFQPTSLRSAYSTIILSFSIHHDQSNDIRFQLDSLYALGRRESLLYRGLVRFTYPLSVVFYNSTTHAESMPILTTHNAPISTPTNIRLTAAPNARPRGYRERWISIWNWCARWRTHHCYKKMLN